MILKNKNENLTAVFNWLSLQPFYLEIKVFKYADVTGLSVTSCIPSLRNNFSAIFFMALMEVLKNPGSRLNLATPIIFSVSKSGMPGSNKTFTGKPTSLMMISICSFLFSEMG